jgi:hypothetical protein
MACELIITGISSEEQARVLGVLTVGCDRETAAAYIGRSPDDITRAMRNDPSFAKEVRRTEASVEVSHMRNLRDAAKDPKNWRISVWWLERRCPERYGARTPGTVTTKQLRAFIQIVGENLNTDIRDPIDRERVAGRLRQVEQYIDRLENDLYSVDAEPIIEPNIAATEGRDGWATEQIIDNADELDK